MSLTQDNVKQLLYILPVLSGLICLAYVRWLNKVDSAASSRPDWRSTDLNLDGGKVGPGAGGAIEMLGLGAADEIINVKKVGLVIEYNDAGLAAHAKKAKITDSVDAIKKQISEVLTKAGLSNAPKAKSPIAADQGNGSIAKSDDDDDSRSSIMFSGSIEKMKRGVWEVRESMAWLRSIHAVQDVGTAYTVQQVGRGMKAKIKFEPCRILFNQE